MRKAVALSIVGALLVALPPFLPAYPLTLLTQTLIYAIFAMSLDLLLGYTGLPSLGHAAYFGVAAYVVAILATEYGAGFWPCLPLALRMVVWGLVAVAGLRLLDQSPHAVLWVHESRHSDPLSARGRDFLRGI